MAEVDAEALIESKVEKLGGNCNLEEKDLLRSIFTNILQKGMSIMEALHFPVEQVELIYSYGCSLYEAGSYKDANRIFFYLVNLNSEDPRFSFAYASSFHKLKEYGEAAAFYLLSAQKDSKNPYPWFHMGDCYIQMDQKDVAVVMLIQAIQVAGEDARYEKLVQQASALRDIILPTLRQEG